MVVKLHGDSVGWVKARGCSDAACVEVRAASDLPGSDILVRASGEWGKWLTFTREEWDAFLAGVRAGDFDG